MHVTRYASADLPTDDEELQEVSLEIFLSGALSTFTTVIQRIWCYYVSHQLPPPLRSPYYVFSHFSVHSY